MELRPLKDEIDELISLEVEGGYWDFKLKWHENNASLLHDIICMANNLENRDAYIPGWEIPKFRPEHFTNDYGFITDYLAEFIRELRKEQCGDALDKYFRLGKNLNQRDTIAVRKMVGGMIKLLYPDGVFTKEELEEVLKFALEMRRRVKEQLKKLGGMEFYDVNFSYIDNETFEEHFVSVPEQGGGKLIPEGVCTPGHIYTVSRAKSGMIGIYRLETQMLPGSGKFERTGIGTDRDAKEATNTAFNYLKANANAISGNISTTNKDYIINYQDLNGNGMKESFAEESEVQRIILTDGIESIGDCAFKDCWKLTQAIFPNTLKEIGQSAFERCYDLDIPIFPSQLGWIGMYAFADTGLKKANLPGSVYWAGEGAFSNCKQLKDVVISLNLTAIADKMFKGCEALSEVKLPDTLQSIGSEVFEGCSALKSVVIPVTVNAIGENAFANVDPEFQIYCQRGSVAEQYAAANGIRIEYSDHAMYARYGKYAKSDLLLERLFDEEPAAASAHCVKKPEQQARTETRSLLKKKIEELEKLLANQTMQDCSGALKIIAGCRLPLNMHLLYGNLIERIAVLEKTAEKYKDDYQVDLTQFYDYYIPELVHITTTFLGYIDDRVGKAIADSAEKEVMAAGQTLLLAINDKINEIYRFASIEVKAKALDAMMNQEGYVDDTYKIN